MKHSSLLLVSVVLAASSAAQAQTNERVHAKSAKVATGVAVAGTLLGPVVMVAGLSIAKSGDRSDASRERIAETGAVIGGALVVAGPSAGEWYAGQWWSKGLVLRVAGGAAIAGGLALADCNVGNGECGELRIPAAIVSAGAGVLAIVGGTVWDLIDSGRAARRWNARHGVEAAIAPTVLSSDGHATAGLAVAGRF